jgi:hypothetical protein
VPIFKIRRKDIERVIDCFAIWRWPKYPSKHTLARMLFVRKYFASSMEGEKKKQGICKKPCIIIAFCS